MTPADFALLLRSTSRLTSKLSRQLAELGVELEAERVDPERERELLSALRRDAPVVVDALRDVLGEIDRSER